MKATKKISYPTPAPADGWGCGRPRGCARNSGFRNPASLAKPARRRAILLGGSVKDKEVSVSIHKKRKLSTAQWVGIGCTIVTAIAAIAVAVIQKSPAHTETPSPPTISTPTPSATQNPPQSNSTMSSSSLPTLVSPRNGALLQPGTDVTLQWNSISGATQYLMEIWGGQYSGTHTTPCGWQNGTSCYIGTMSPGNVLWHVKARDGSGNESPWSDDWNFTPQ